MQQTSWLRNFIYLVLLLALAIAGSMVMRNLNLAMQQEFNVQPLLLFGLDALFFVLAGFILALEPLYKEAQKIGRWKIDWKKWILCCLPFLFLSLSFVFYYSEWFTVHLPALQKPAEWFMTDGDTIFLKIFQIALGYFFLTGFYKED